MPLPADAASRAWTGRIGYHARVTATSYPMSDKADNAGTVQDPVEYFFAKQWSDGLPVVPPTEERLSAMLAGTRRDPDELIGLVPPLMSPATVRAIAIHAVMAGCKPEYMPVLIGAMECVLEERFNLLLLQATTSAGAPFLLVSGPYAREIRLHGGMGCFGPGFRANATIGRALRLIMMNLGGAIPGITA